MSGNMRLPFFIETVDEDGLFVPILFDNEFAACILPVLLDNTAFGITGTDKSILPIVVIASRALDDHVAAGILLYREGAQHPRGVD
jgi:hypothetical protein